MTLSILFTKLYIPPARSERVARGRLIERLSVGLHSKLTLISAPAGFGKTTLIGEWLTVCGRPAAWLSLDEDDNDPARFLAYCISALQTVLPDIGKGLLTSLQSPQPPAIESVLTVLLNEIAASPQHFILALDDYHIIDSPAVDHALTFLLDHLPSQMHLVITTRADPSLPLARLRAQGQLSELRAADLRFTLEEAQDFFNKVMGMHLTAEDIAALDARIEGWVAGLQLAALALQSTHADAKNFIASFGGNHRFVLDYLLEEVLNQQSAHIQTFLTQTAILDRMCGKLCDAIIGDSPATGQETLDALERANLFLIPLDNERKWYRYHHLFVGLLRQRLMTTATQVYLNDLHIRASQWYEDNGLELEAFHHAAAGQDIERAERLMDGSGIPMHLRGAALAIQNWLDSLPVEVLDARPRLWLRSAGLMLVNGQTTGVEDRLKAMEGAIARAETLSANEEAHLRGRSAVVRATLALTRYDVDTMLNQSRYALDHLPPENLASRATALWTLGHAYIFQRDFAAAEPPLQESVRLAQQCGDIFTVILSTIGLGLVKEGQNQLYRAAEIYQSVLQQVGEQPLQIIAEVHLGLARICYQWDDLDKAEHHGRLSLELARQFDHVIDRFVLSEIFLALLKLAQGAPAAALSMLEQTHETARRKGFIHRLAEIAGAQVLALLRLGDIAAASALVQAHDLPVCQARVHLAQGRLSAVQAALEKYHPQRTESPVWPTERLEIMLIQALMCYARGDNDQALAIAGEVLTIAEPQGFVRLFVDEGQAMTELLRLAPQGSYVQHLLTILAAESASPPEAAGNNTLVEPLTERELEVLRLVAEGLSNREISEQLFVALDTVKGHNRRIFEKLHVQRRTEAVARARDLELI